MRVSRTARMCLVVLAAGCHADAALPKPEAPAVLRVRVLAADADYSREPFSLSIDAQSPVSFQLPEATVIREVLPATHALRFESPDPGCRFLGGNERSVVAILGDTTDVVVDVSCVGRFGTVQLETRTTGPDADVDGYAIHLEGLGTVSLERNDTVVLSRVPAGALVMSGLDGVASNCAPRAATPDGSTAVPSGRAITVAGGGRTTVVVRVDCHPVIRDRILFHTHVEGGLYSIHPDGHSLQTLRPPGTFRGGEMSLSPDGSRLAWAHGVGVDSRNGMTIMFLDGVVIAEVFGDRPVTHPSWSRDGAMIVADDFQNILAVKPDGTQPQVVRQGREPDLLHAGGPLVFSVGGMRVAATLTAPDSPVGGSGAIPRWSPDGSQVVFLRVAAPAGRFQMFVMNADGSASRQMTYFPFGLGAPTWSPDGSRIAFGGDNNIWIAAPAGAGTLHRMDLPPLASLPMWSQVP